MRAPFFRLVLRTKRVFQVDLACAKRRRRLFVRVRRPPPAEGRGGSPVADCDKIKFTARSYHRVDLNAIDATPARWRGDVGSAHAEALATLRRYDQGLLSEKQVARAMDRLFHPSDHELRDAFRYFLPAELAV